LDASHECAPAQLLAVLALTKALMEVATKYRGRLTAGWNRGGISSGESFGKQAVRCRSLVPA
jgi:hypothetical protein